MKLHFCQKEILIMSITGSSPKLSMMKKDHRTQPISDGEIGSRYVSIRVFYHRLPVLTGSIAISFMMLNTMMENKKGFINILISFPGIMVTCAMFCDHDLRKKSKY